MGLLNRKFNPKHHTPAPGEVVKIPDVKTAPAVEYKMKRYGGERHFQNDAKKMAAQGWRVHTQSSATIGIFAQIQVTWIRGGEPAAVAAPTSSTADELLKLASLRDAGVLTDEEFAAQKASLLA